MIDIQLPIHHRSDATHRFPLEFGPIDKFFWQMIVFFQIISITAVNPIERQSGIYIPFHHLHSDARRSSFDSGS